MSEWLWDGEAVALGRVRGSDAYANRKEQISAARANQTPVLPGALLDRQHKHIIHYQHVHIHTRAREQTFTLWSIEGGSWNHFACTHLNRHLIQAHKIEDWQEHRTTSHEGFSHTHTHSQTNRSAGRPSVAWHGVQAMSGELLKHHWATVPVTSYSHMQSIQHISITWDVRLHTVKSFK